MGEILSVCGVGIFAVFAVCVIREIRRELTVPLILTLCVVFLCWMLPKISSAIGFVQECFVFTDENYIGYILRALGITYITWTSSEICKSVGENGIAGYVETAGRVEIVVLCLPLLEEFLEVALM